MLIVGELRRGGYDDDRYNYRRGIREYEKTIYRELGRYVLCIRVEIVGAGRGID